MDSYRIIFSIFAKRFSNWLVRCSIRIVSLADELIKDPYKAPINKPRHGIVGLVTNNERPATLEQSAFNYKDKAPRKRTRLPDLLESVSRTHFHTAAASA